MTAVSGPRTIYRNPSRAARPLPEASGSERAWWYFMRFSGLALVFLALGHKLLESAESREIEPDRLEQIHATAFERWLDEEVRAPVPTWVDPQFATTAA